MTKKLSQVALAYQRCDAARHHLLTVLDAVPMECTEDKAGIVWERFLLGNGVSVVLFATPTWWDIYRPAAIGTAVTDRTLAEVTSVAQAYAPRAEGARVK